MISIVGLGLIKSSLLVMYKDIFVIRRFRIAVYTVLAYVIGWTVSFTIAHLFTRELQHTRKLTLSGSGTAPMRVSHF